MTNLRLFLLKLCANLIFFDYLSKDTFWLDLNGFTFCYCILCYTAYITSSSITQFVLSILVNLFFILYFPVPIEVEPSIEILEEDSETKKRILFVFGLFVIFCCYFQI